MRKAILLPSRTLPFPGLSKTIINTLLSATNHKSSKNIFSQSKNFLYIPPRKLSFQPFPSQIAPGLTCRHDPPSIGVCSQFVAQPDPMKPVRKQMIFYRNALTAHGRYKKQRIFRKNCSICESMPNKSLRKCFCDLLFNRL